MTRLDPLILITRPHAAATEFASQLKSAQPDIKVAIHPLQEIEFVAKPHLIDAHFAAYVFTSTNAVDAALKWQLPPRPCFVVGPKTAEAAQAISNDIHNAQGTADDLLQSLFAIDIKGPVLYVRGAHVSTDLKGRAEARGIEIHEKIGYIQQDIKPSADLLADLARGGNPVILPLFSARSAKLVLRAARPEKHWHVIAMSRKVASLIDPKTVKNLNVAIRPDGPSMQSAVLQVWRECTKGELL